MWCLSNRCVLIARQIHFLDTASSFHRCMRFLCIAEDEHITSEWKCSFCSSGPGPCWCYVILVFAFVAVFICAASLFSLFHRYIVAGDKICCCPPQLQVERETEKHDVVWMLTTVKSTEFGILTGKTSTVLLYSEYLFTVQCFGYYMTGKNFGGEKSASCSITNSPH